MTASPPPLRHKQLCRSALCGCPPSPSPCALRCGRSSQSSASASKRSSASPIRSSASSLGTPILTGSLVRIVLGIWTGRYGGRVVYTVTMLAARRLDLPPRLAETYPQMLLAALGRRNCRWVLRRRRDLRLTLLPARAAGHRARHFRRRQCRRGGDQVPRALPAARLGLAGGRSDLGGGPRRHGRGILVRHAGRPGVSARGERSIEQELRRRARAAREVRRSGVSPSTTSSCSGPSSPWRSGCRATSSASMASTSRRQA